MSVSAQAPDAGKMRAVATAAARGLGILCLVVPLAACMTGGSKTAALDTATQTASVHGPQPDATSVSDSATIRNAVSAADMELLKKGEALAWANSDTGSRGTISSVSESNADGALCRTFTTSRESYDGVGLYQGEACQGDRGDWQLQQFKRM